LEESKISLPQEGDVKEIVIKQETPPIQVEEKTKKLVNHTIVDNEPKKGVIFDNIIAMDEAIWWNTISECCSDKVKKWMTGSVYPRHNYNWTYQCCNGCTNPREGC